MKQRIFVALASLVLAALVLLMLPPIHAPAPQPTIPTTTPPTTQAPTTQPPTTQPPPVGVIRLYSCDPAVRAILAGLASDYTAQTGVDVVILAPAQEDCQASLQQLLESEDPPTAFCVHSRNQLEGLASTALDLKSSSLASLLRSEDLTIRVEDRWLGIPMGLKAYGLLMNAELLAGIAQTRSDITDLTSLSTVVKILKDNSVKAFPTLAPTPEEAWYLLGTQEPTHARAFLDLYLTNYIKSGDGLTQFLDGKAAFLPGGSWEFDTLASYTGREFHVRNLDILPTYIGGAMQYLCQWAWAFHGAVSQEDMEATQAFFCWLATPGETSAAPIDLLQTLNPFAGSGWYGNQLEKKLLGYMSNEAAIVDFDNASAENEVLPAALTTYLQAPTDENWEQLLLCIQLTQAPPLTQD